MADFNKPQITDPYADVLQAVRDMFTDLVKGLDGTATSNLPGGALRWNSVNKRFEKWNGSAWTELIAKATDKYDINVDRVDGLDAGNANGNIPINNGTLNTNLNAEKLGGQLGSYYAPASTVATAQAGADAANTAASSANTNANNRVAKTGDSMTGQLSLPGGGSGNQAATVTQAQTFANTAEANATAVANTKATAADVATKLGKSGDTANELYNNGWYRSNGNVGWYNQTYGGGLWMSDGTWVRVYGGKSFLTDWHQFSSGGNIWTASYGWLHDRFTQKGTGIENCAGQSANVGGYIVGLTRSGTSLGISLTTTNCNCNCNCGNN